ncbi:MAG TPA: hypothetical protein VGG33_14775 [Polyangia bacterium]
MKRLHLSLRSGLVASLALTSLACPDDPTPPPRPDAAVVDAAAETAPAPDARDVAPSLDLALDVTTPLDQNHDQNDDDVPRVNPGDAADAGGDAITDAASDAGGTDTGGPALTVLTGAFPLYHVPKNIMGAKPRNDASGVVFLPATQQLLVIDDGGEDATPDEVPFYVTGVANLFLPPITMIEVPGPATLPLSLPAKHRDMEALAFDSGFTYVMSSLPAESEKPEVGNRRFSRFKLTAGQITDEATIEPRAAILDAISKPTTDPWFAEWLARWRDLKAKDGGLQVEALSATPAAGKLLVALRSPHYSAGYLLPKPADPIKKETRVGAAMLVEIDVTAFAVDKLAARVFANVDLGGLGFRGMEHSPTAGGYFITAGAVEAGFDYGFYFWNGNPAKAPVNLASKVPAFAKLCRPESVAEVAYGGKKYLLVLSEESGAICETPAAPYNYLLIELNAALLDLLD